MLETISQLNVKDISIESSQPDYLFAHGVDITESDFKRMKTYIEECGRDSMVGDFLQSAAKFRVLFPNRFKEDEMFKHISQKKLVDRVKNFMLPGSVIPISEVINFSWTKILVPDFFQSVSVDKEKFMKKTWEIAEGSDYLFTKGRAYAALYVLFGEDLKSAYNLELQKELERLRNFLVSKKEDKSFLNIAELGASLRIVDEDMWKGVSATDEQIRKSRDNYRLSMEDKTFNGREPFFGLDHAFSIAVISAKEVIVNSQGLSLVMHTSETLNKNVTLLPERRKF